MEHSKVIEFILDLLYPPRCVFCRALLRNDEKDLCTKCQPELPWITGEQARQKLEFVSTCISPLWYQGQVRDSIHRFKFSDRSGYANAYGHFIVQCIEDHLHGAYDFITWVPLSRKRMRQRGYNQAKLLADSIAYELGNITKETLRKIRETNAQSGLNNDAARRANVIGAYEVVAPEDVQGKRILLIDDVVTTGSTLSECARILRIYGAEDVVCATLARARGDKNS